MSFTTRCPACGTTFRIVADQLKISEGWVRCGHCADVFDATLYLEPWAAGAPAPSGSAPAPDVPPVEPAGADLADGDDLVTRSPDSMADDPPADPSVDADFSTELQRFAAAKATPEAQAAALVAPVSDVDSESPAQAPQDLGAEPVERAVPEAVPGFVRQAQRRAFWQSRGVRVGLSLLALLLAAVLVAQWVLHERDRIAAWKPETLPWLQQLCEPIGCTVGPVRNIDAIVIDSSALVQRLGNFHSFDLVLKNTADMALALPALELSLTNSRDEVISRRVFLPEEWPDAPSVMPAKSSLNVSFRLSLSVGEAMPMAGYRALVFYP